MGCISEASDEEYVGVVGSFVNWSEENHLTLNISNTKEPVVDFRRSGRKPTIPITFERDVIKIAESYKFS